MNQKIIAGFVWLVLCVLGHQEGWGQQIILDKPVRAGDLTLFPEVNNEKSYYYLVDKVRLATDANGKPQFSFLKYANNVKPGVGNTKPGEAEGGGIFHALVTLSVSEEQLQDARRELVKLAPGAQIMGPVVYKSGKFGLVSAFKDADGSLSQKVVGIGNAPIIDGQKAAISIQLTKLGAELLWESFKSPTPDISFTFEMDITGFRAPKRAIIEANFDQIYEHQSFGVGVASSFLAGEISATFDDLTREGAIKITQIGEDAKMEELITTAYNKLTDMMFSPLNGTGTPNFSNITSAGGTSGGSLLDRASTMLTRNRQEARTNNRERAANRSGNSGARTASGTTEGTTTDSETTADAGEGHRPPIRARTEGIEPPSEGPVESDQANGEETVPQLAILASFEMKRIRQRGTFRIDLNKYTVDNMSMRFDENIGDLSKFMNDQKYFREVNLDNPLFTQREISATVDVGSLQDFVQYVNFVNVRITKKHEGGDISTDELKIDRENFNKEGNNFSMMYGWKADQDRNKWRDYEYEIDWSIIGDNNITIPAQKSRSNALNLAPPYQMRFVELQADPGFISDKGIRSINVKVFYKVGEKEFVKQIDLNPSKGLLSGRIDYLSKPNELGYEYEVTWKLRGQQTESSGRKKATDTILFVDEL